MADVGSSAGAEQEQDDFWQIRRVPRRYEPALTETEEPAETDTTVTEPAFEEAPTVVAAPMPGIPALEVPAVDRPVYEIDAIDWSYDDPPLDDAALARRGRVQVSALGAVVLAVAMTGVIAASSVSGHGTRTPKAVSPVTGPTPAALPADRTSPRPLRTPNGHGTPATSRLSRQHQRTPTHMRGVNSPSSQRPTQPSPAPSPQQTCWRTIGVFKLPCN